MEIHPDFLIPDDMSALTDDDVGTCTKFKAVEEIKERQFTTFRIQLDENSELDIFKSVIVSLIGEDMGCSQNLHVMPLIAQQTKTWSGVWSTCPLIEKSSENGIEKCVFQCQCNGGCQEIQVCKRPRTFAESTWKLCHICLYNGKFNNFPLCHNFI